MAEIDASVSNATAMWSAVAFASSTDDTLFRAETTRVTRLVLRSPAPADAITKLLEGVPATRATVLEDAFGTHPVAIADPAVRILQMPVMRRPAGSVPAGPGRATRVVPVADPDELAAAERTIVEGFPVSALLPWRRGEALPAAVLDVAGWTVWLAYAEGRPAAAAYTFDDGRVVGVYWLVTVPGNRSAGLGREVMTRAINAHPARPFMLTATPAGQPLYESMGFRPVTTATWYLRPAA